jgi:hypothetical protein
MPRILRKRKARRAAAGCFLLIAAGLAILLYNPVRTLTSLRKVDDFPVYVIEYRGGYLFEHFRKIGIEEHLYPRLLEAAYPDACTCFAALNPEGDAILGRNFDWHHRPTLVLFTDPPHGYTSVSLVSMVYLGYGAERIGWTYPVGLLFAPYMPMDGMNEAGLAVGAMGVDHARYSGDPQKVTIGSPHAIRLLLDHAGSVKEAVSLLERHNIFFGKPPVHYLVVDASGDAAVIEFIDDEMHVIRNEQPWQVATNFLISEQDPDGPSSPCWRYNQAYRSLNGANGIVSQQETMAILEDVSNSHTIWSAVYNVTAGSIRLAVGRNYDRVYTFELRKSSTGRAIAFGGAE